MTLAAMSGKRTLHECRVRTSSCLYLSVSSCSLALLVLMTSFLSTITSWKKQSKSKISWTSIIIAQCINVYACYKNISGSKANCGTHLLYIAGRHQIQGQLQGLLADLKIRGGQNPQNIHHQVLRADNRNMRLLKRFVSEVNSLQRSKQLRTCSTRSCVGCSFSSMRRSRTMSLTLLSLSLMIRSM